MVYYNIILNVFKEIVLKAFLRYDRNFFSILNLSCSALSECNSAFSFPINEFVYWKEDGCSECQTMWQAALWGDGIIIKQDFPSPCWYQQLFHIHVTPIFNTKRTVSPSRKGPSICIVLWEQVKPCLNKPFTSAGGFDDENYAEKLLNFGQKDHQNIVYK